VRRAGFVVVLAAALAPAALPASATATAALPVAWRATSPATLNEPVLTSNGVVTTAGELATARVVAHGETIWQKSLASQFPGYALEPPTVWNGTIDSVLTSGFATGVSNFAVGNGTFTISSQPAPHQFFGQLVTDATTSTRVTGGFGSFGAVAELALGGEKWLVLFGQGSVGLPTLVGSEAFVPVSSTVEGIDPAQRCKPATPNEPLCAPTWQTTTPGTAQTPVASGAGRIATSDSSGVVTAFKAKTGAIAWQTASFHTPLGQPAYANNVVYAGGADGVLRAINAATGKVLWTASAGAPIRTAPTVSGARVFVATDNGRLVTFNAAGCGKATCAPTAVGNAALANTQAAGAPLVRNHTAIVAYGTHLIAFTV
jgi:outer membrane protein assembly factor BamB